MNSIRPFKIDVSDSDISDLQNRLAQSRWPDQINDADWSYGTDLNYLKKLVQYWQTDFDWRRQEQNINQYDQFLTTIDGLDTHFIHQRSPHANATPILINHGWPGSIVEFLQLIPRLTEPEKFGGSSEHAFHVVCPSLPGYGYSQPAQQAGMGTRQIAQRHVKLMAALGYKKYISQGGDWGAMISRQIADCDPEHCQAIHLNMVLAMPPKGVDDPLAQVSREEQQALAASQELFSAEGMGYFQIQSTRPQTLAYGLNDSPLGLCAWITEKYRAWSDCDGDIQNTIEWDRLLTIISLYWFSRSIGSSIRLYLEENRNGHPLTYIATPTGVAQYKREIMAPPKAWVEASYNLAHYFKADRGGHFAALEQPQIFAENLWDFQQTIAQL